VHIFLSNSVEKYLIFQDSIPRSFSAIAINMILYYAWNQGME